MSSSACAFSNAILSSRCACEYAYKECVAEKEFARCNNEKSAQRCAKLYDFLRTNSTFATSSVGVNVLSVAQQNKIRIGGILALQNILHNNKNVTNINALVSDIINTYHSIEELPIQDIISDISRFKLR